MTQHADTLSRKLEALAGPRIESLQQRVSAMLHSGADAATLPPAPAASLPDVDAEPMIAVRAGEVDTPTGAEGITAPVATDDEPIVL
jgi:hypothetical protein